MINGRSGEIHIVQPEEFSWSVRRVPNWLGGTEFMFEIIGADGCVSFGDTVEGEHLILQCEGVLIIRHCFCCSC